VAEAREALTETGVCSLTSETMMALICFMPVIEGVMPC
jgi:hypothetical protein